MALLSKSLYKDGRDCPKRAWYGAHHRELARPPTEGERARMMEGVELGKMATLFFPGGRDCRIAATEEENAAHTAHLLAQPEDVFFEASFLADGCFVRTDILVREPEGWRIIEVKSSSSVKPDHIDDVAFQMVVMEAAGHPVAAVEVMHVNREWRAEDGAETFFKRQEVTAECRKAVAKIQKNSGPIRLVIESPIAPPAILNTFCKDCVYLENCQPSPEPDDIIFLPSIRREQVASLRAAGVSRIQDIPEDFNWTDRQQRVRQALRTSAPVLDPSLGERLSAIKFPAAFIDFETSMWSRPPFAGMRPYDAVPFQWSLHLVDENGGETHREFLMPGREDPRRQFAEELYQEIAAAESVIFYSNYEAQQIASLAKAGVPFASELNNLLTERGVDLLKILQDCVYFEEFRGSFSIKAVLPALVADLSYSSLRIQNGEMAVREFKRLFSDALSPDREKEIRDALLAYCRLDTLAMVRIYQRLRELSDAQSAVSR